MGLDFEVGAGRAAGPPQILPGIRVPHPVRMGLRNLVHVEVERDDVRVVVAPPDVFQALAAGVPAVLAVAVLKPVGHAVQAVRPRRLPVRALHPAPQKPLDVVLDGLDLSPVRAVHVLHCQERRLGQGRIVAAEHIAPPAVETVRVAGAAQYGVAHVPDGEEAVVPLVRIPMLLLFDQEPAPLVQQHGQRLGDKELQQVVPILPVADRDEVLAQPREPHAVQIAFRIRAGQGFDDRLRGVLRLQPVVRVPGPDRYPRLQILGHGHARRDPDVEAALLVEDLPHALPIVGPAEAEAVGQGVGFGVARSQDRACVRLSPSARGSLAGGPRVDKDPIEHRGTTGVRLDLFVELQLGSGLGRHDQERTLAVRPEPDLEGAVARDIALACHHRRVVGQVAALEVVVERQRQGQIADLHRCVRAVADGNGPVEAGVGPGEPRCQIHTLEAMHAAGVARIRELNTGVSVGVPDNGPHVAGAEGPHVPPGIRGTGPHLQQDIAQRLSGTDVLRGPAVVPQPQAGQAAPVELQQKGSGFICAGH